MTIINIDGNNNQSSLIINSTTSKIKQLDLKTNKVSLADLSGVVDLDYIYNFGLIYQMVDFMVKKNQNYFLY